VCAHADDDFGSKGTFPEAAHTCESLGGRLCTADELVTGCGDLNTGRYHNGCNRQEHAWSATPCNVYQSEAEAEREALKLATKLVTLAPEFHTSSENKLEPKLRSDPPTQQAYNRSYKAIVVVLLSGGMDSFHLLRPYDNCSLHQEYVKVRGEAYNTGKHNKMVPITVAQGTQPCDTFGIHSKFDLLKKQFEEGDAAIIANMGGLVEPLTKAEFTAGRKLRPLQLFAHNKMQKAAQSVDARNKSANGVLGRMHMALSNLDQPFKSSMYSIAGTKLINNGAPPAVGPTYVDKAKGVEQLAGHDVLGDTIADLTERRSESLFAETFSSGLESGIRDSLSLGAKLSGTSTHPKSDFGGSKFSQQLEQAARLVKLHTGDDAELGDTERATFVTEYGGWDSHHDVSGEGVANKLSTLNSALKGFTTEMKKQGNWDNVAVVLVSEFGRTLSTNGGGTDHAWGGNYAVLGGGVNGGHMLGAYPSRLTEEGDLVLKRGRVIPTTSWEAVWNGVAEWYGVPAADMEFVLPNSPNFPSGLFSKDDLFE